MNPKLKFVYKQTNVPGWSGTTCDIGIEVPAGKYGGFTSLGLEVGQKELTPKQVTWFEQHGDAVVAACEAYANADPKTCLIITYRKIWKDKTKLLDKFCKDCNIKDS